MNVSHLLTAALAATVLSATPVMAQQPQRLAGEIQRVDGQMLTVKYKVQGKPDEEKKILVSKSTIIATTVAATKDDLKPGLRVFVAGAPKLPDGSLDVGAIQVEKEIPPPQ